MIYEIEKTIDVAELFGELSDNDQKDFIIEKFNDSFYDDDRSEIAFECVSSLDEWRQVDLIKNLVNHLGTSGQEEIKEYLNEN